MFLLYHGISILSSLIEAVSSRCPRKLTGHNTLDKPWDAHLESTMPKACQNFCDLSVCKIVVEIAAGFNLMHSSATG